MNDQRVDELRQQLKALGYLDAGVDRFVLGGARATRGPIATAARTSLRVGLLGGVLLGPAAAIGVGARLPGLVSGVRDAVVLAAYLAVVFVAGLTIASFASSVTAAALTRRRMRRARALAPTTGWLVALATLSYLTIWWRNASAGFGWQAPVLTASVLALAVLISLLLGHAVRIATLGTMAAAAEPDAALPPVYRVSWLMTAALGALAFSGAAVLLVLTTARDSHAPAVVPALTVVSQGARVRVLAVDGIDPALGDAREWLSGWGYQGYRYAVSYDGPVDPARTWTTIATGEPPEVHGINGIEGRRVAGLRGMLSAETSATGRVLQQATDLVRLTQPSVASRSERKVMTFWEVAEAAGLRTAVFNWWATWPTGTRSGIVVSDRAVLRLERGGSLDAEVSPPEAYATLRTRWPDISRTAAALAQRSFADITDRKIAETLVRSGTLDAIVIGMNAALADQNRDLDVVYLPGLDIAQHALLSERGSAGASPSILAQRLAALGAYHRFLGSLIRPWLRPTNKDVAVIVTAPGRVGANATGHLTVGTWIEAPAAIDAHDVHVRAPGPAFEDAADTLHAIDVAPTIVNLLGIPISREWPGRAVHASPLAAQPVRFVATYGRPPAQGPSRAGAPLDQETIDRLRSLGYIK